MAGGQIVARLQLALTILASKLGCSYLSLTVFSIDYSDKLDLLVSGSADTTVKLWCLSEGVLLNTLPGHSDWVTQVCLISIGISFLLEEESVL